MADLPLDGVKVIDFSRVLAGPLASMVLADLGADVIKVEHPERGDDTRDWGLPLAPHDTTYFYSFNRNKRSVTLDLTTPTGQAQARALVAEADIVVENFRPGVMERFGLGFEALAAVNPKLVYCAISGYDRYGPEKDRPGYDLVIQGESGLMSINGDPDGPALKFGIAAVDIFTGMSAAQAVLAALYQAARTGKGRRIDLALYDCGIALTTYYGLDALLLGKDPARVGNAHPSIVPYGVFEAADGPLVIAVGNNSQYGALCHDVIGRPDLAADPRYATNLDRSRNRQPLLAELNAVFAARSRASLLEDLSRVGIPCGEVLGLHAAVTSSRTDNAGLVGHHSHPVAGSVAVLSPPWRFDGERVPVRRPPMLGEHDTPPKDFSS